MKNGIITNARLTVLRNQPKDSLLIDGRLALDEVTKKVPEGRKIKWWTVFTKREFWLILIELVTLFLNSIESSYENNEV